jgi:RimJ/RimL family protein N-acetyltransferase
MGRDQGARAAEDPLDVAPGEWGRRTTLRDDTPVLLRQIRPEDRERLVEGLRALSPASRYMRFHANIDALTDEQLDYLSRVDHVDHEAIVALDLDNPEVPGIGVARYIRELTDPRVAEAAITVADDYQGRGAGTMLLGALCARARENGVEVFRNYVLAKNQAMLAVLDELGATRELEAEGLWRVDLALPEREGDLPDSPAGRAFMAAAKDGLRLSSAFPPVWSYLPSRGISRSSLAAGMEDELAGLGGELDTWLLEREQRRSRWPPRHGDTDGHGHTDGHDEDGGPRDEEAEADAGDGEESDDRG